MRMIAIEGVRLDRPPMSDLDLLWFQIRTTPYIELSEVAKLRLKLALDLQHHEREQIRFAPITERMHT